MEGKAFKESLIYLTVVALLFSPGVLAARSEYSNRDLKGEVFLMISDPAQQPQTTSILKEEMENFFESEQGLLKLVSIDGLDQKAVAKQILALPAEHLERLGGSVEIEFEEAQEHPSRAVIEVYHYPFGSIAEEHVKSPEYSFKFGSDSALLAIHIYEALRDELGGEDSLLSELEVRPALSANPYLPQEILRKGIRLILQMDQSASGVPSPEQIRRLAGTVHAAAAAFHHDEGNYAMGLIPDKAQRHGRIEDVEIHVFRYLYPDQDFTREEATKRREEVSKPILVVKPFPSKLYYVAGLDRLTPYSLKFIDSSKDEDDFWHEMEQGSLVTSSLKGVVRTVPGVFKGYTPLKSAYQAPPDEVPQAERLDYIITRATVIPGLKDKPRFIADVGIAGERIAAVGDLSHLSSDVTIDGKGLFLTPGFIDIHSHADANILEVSYAPSHIRQGITTVLGGNCSSSPLGIGSFLAELEDKGAAVNIGMLLGNRPVREQVLGRRKGMFSYSDLYRQKELVDLAMEEGAFGMSTGLIYRISEEAFAWELAELAKQIKPYGGFYASHVRGESDEVLDAIREAIYIGEIAEVPVQISHMKVINRRNWGDMERYLDIMKAARTRGMDVTGDQYPWRASGPAAHYTLYRLLVREAIKGESPDVILLKDMPGKYKKYSGKALPELLEGENLTPEELITELNLTEESRIYATYLCLGDDDVCRPMREDFVMVCTDSSLASLENIEKGKHWDDHPRKFRTYPEFFSKYVRDRALCSWELGVYKCTGLPAKKMKLRDRGVIRAGAYADVVLFDPENLDPGVDYRDQAALPEGIEWVFLNGQPVLKEGELANARAGKALRAKGNRKP